MSLHVLDSNPLTPEGVLHFVLLQPTFPSLENVFFLARPVGRSRVQQRKCNADCARLEAFQTRWTLNCAVHTPPARSSAVRLQPPALRPLTLSVGTVCPGKRCRSVSRFCALCLSACRRPTCLLVNPLDENRRLDIQSARRPPRKLLFVIKSGHFL